MRIIHHTENLPKLVGFTLIRLVCHSVNAKNLGSTLFFFFFFFFLCLYTTLWVMTDLSVSPYIIKPGLQPPIYPFLHCLAVSTSRLLEFFLFLGLNFGFTLQVTPRLLDHLSAPTPTPFSFLLLSLLFWSILNILMERVYNLFIC